MGKHREVHAKPNRRRKPDYRKLSAALQAYVAAQAEADAEAQRTNHGNVEDRPTERRRGRP